MPNAVKKSFLEELERRYGKLKKLGKGYSLYELCDGAARIYIRFSKVHDRRQTFFGLREEDLRELAGHPSFICYLWNDQLEPLFIPFSEYEEVFHSVSPASDGQYKALIFLQDDCSELYIANAGRFNIEGHFGWDKLETALGSEKHEQMQEFTHSKIQTYLGAIGDARSFDIWFPTADRNKLDWTDITPFKCCNILPPAYRQVKEILEEVDVIWIRKGSGEIKSTFRSRTLNNNLFRSLETK